MITTIPQSNKNFEVLCHYIKVMALMGKPSLRQHIFCILPTLLSYRKPFNENSTKTGVLHNLCPPFISNTHGCGSGWCRLLNGRKDEKRELAGCCAHPFQVSRPQKSRYPSPQLRAAPIHRTSLHYWPPSARPSVRLPARPAECRVRFRFCDTTSKAVDAAAAGGRARAGRGSGERKRGCETAALILT